MVKLQQDSRGSYRARKRIPDDVRDEYGKRYGVRFEAKFSAPAGTTSHEAKRLFHEWEADVASRVSTIRAERTGEGISLSDRQARALAGEWYEWFIARHPTNDRQNWETLQEKLHDAERAAIGESDWEKIAQEEIELRSEELRKALRPLVADVGETAQFLGMKGIVLNNEARGLFIDWLYEDLAAAIRRLIRLSEGDYSADSYAPRFPVFAGADAGDTPIRRARTSLSRIAITSDRAAPASVKAESGSPLKS
jgi:hypothetical protein